jgi:imidazole glycerol-phosphate synthase subunit HisF
MLKRRVIPVLLLKNGLIVRSELFRHHQIIGDPTTQLRRYNQWQVDELVYLDISREGDYDVRRSDAQIATSGDVTFLDIIEEISRHSFMPLTVGGRIRTRQDIRARLERGADKVTLNTIAHDDPEFITAATTRFGSQCIVASIDVRRDEDGHCEVYRGGHQPTGKDPVAWAREVERRGAGEILLNSIDRDGTGRGYDIDLISAVCDAVRIPVIALGGVGDWSHMRTCLNDTRVAAVAAANKFHFTEMSYRQAKHILMKSELPVRRPIAQP